MISVHTFGHNADHWKSLPFPWQLKNNVAQRRRRCRPILNLDVFRRRYPDELQTAGAHQVVAAFKRRTETTFQDGGWHWSTCSALDRCFLEKESPAKRTVAKQGPSLFGVPGQFAQYHMFDLLNCGSFSCHRTSTSALSLFPANTRSSAVRCSCRRTFFRFALQAFSQQLATGSACPPWNSSLLVCLHPVDSSVLLSAASFPLALQAGFQ